jgi:hypothetical protein
MPGPDDGSFALWQHLLAACLAAADGGQLGHGGIPIPGHTHRLLNMAGARRLRVVRGSVDAAAADVVCAAPIGLAHVVSDTLGDAARLVLSRHAATVTALRMVPRAMDVSAMSAALVAALPSLPALTTLSCSAFCALPVLAELPAACAQLPWLRRLRLTGRGNDRGVHGAALGEVLAAMVAPLRLRLTELRLELLQLGDAGFAALAAALHGMPRLRRLTLRWVGLSSGRSDGLAALVASLPALAELDLSSNGLGGSATTVVRDGLLRGSRRLTALDLSSMGLDEAALAAVAAALPQLPLLRRFAVYDIHLPDVLPVVRALAACPELRAIGLSIDDPVMSIDPDDGPGMAWLTRLRDAAPALGVALAKLASLRHLTLHANPRASQTAERVFGAMGASRVETLRLPQGAVSDTLLRDVLPARFPLLVTLAMALGGVHALGGLPAVCAMLRALPRLARAQIYGFPHRMDAAAVVTLAAAAAVAPELRVMQLALQGGCFSPAHQRLLHDGAPATRFVF